MRKSASVLGVPHQLQGPKFAGYVHNPTYSRFIEDLIKREVGFVFEEASGRGPSIAEDLAKSLLGSGHYLDVDPSRDERPKYGIAMDVGGGQRLTPVIPPMCMNIRRSTNRGTVKNSG
jgi:hypothetical protein